MNYTSAALGTTLLLVLSNSSAMPTGPVDPSARSAISATGSRLINGMR